MVSSFYRAVTEFKVTLEWLAANGGFDGIGGCISCLGQDASIFRSVSRPSGASTTTYVVTVSRLIRDFGGGLCCD